MVCHNINKRINGSGVIETLLTPFTERKYGNEMHARSLDPNHFLQGYNWTGPRTEVRLRQQLHDDVPLNDLDAAAKEHDLAYLREKEEYQKDNDKQKHLNNIWRADDVFVNKAKNSRNDPIMGNISSKLIATKEGLEKAGIMDSKRFSGIGKNEDDDESVNSDPVKKLRDFVKHQYKTERKKENKKKIQKGGIAPVLIPIAVAGLSAIAGKLGQKLTEDLYNWIKSKITSGSGVKIPYHRTKQQKYNL